MLDVALPLVHSEDLSQTTGFDPKSGEKSSLSLPRGVADAVQAMGLSHSIGSVRLLQARPGFLAPGPLSMQRAQSTIKHEIRLRLCYQCIVCVCCCRNLLLVTC